MSNSGAPLLQVVITEEDAGDRLDRFLARYCDSLSRSRIQSLIEIGSVQVVCSHHRAIYRVKNGDHIDITIPEPTQLDITPENIPLTVPYEDNDLLIIDKGPGMTVHPAPGNWSGTLVNALLHRCDDLSGINGILRPGIVHRLDRDTTGLMIVAKTDVAHRDLAAQLEARTVKRTYSAIVWGHPDEGRIEAPLGRRLQRQPGHACGAVRAQLVPPAHGRPPVALREGPGLAEGRARRLDSRSALDDADRARRGSQGRGRRAGRRRRRKRWCYSRAHRRTTVGRATQSRVRPDN